MRFRQYIAEVKNTISADINEILLGLELIGGKWSMYDNSGYVKKQLENRKKQAPDVEAQSERAKVMAKEVLAWAKKAGYKGRVVRAWWTARPGELAKAVGRQVDSRKNPTDTLIQFSDGKFLGLSAKSTKGKSDITFKNPGIGSLEKLLGISLNHHLIAVETEFVNKHSFSTSKKPRKAEIRASAETKAEADALGTEVLNKVREDLFKKLNSMDQESLRDHIMDVWMDSGDTYPPYVKVTGFGAKAPFTAKVEDPLKNDKVANLNFPIKLEKLGNDTVGVIANNKRVLKMRAKFESQKLASTIKFVGDPWK